jgi:TatD DNase family protein
MLIDTHCHINFKEFQADADSVIQRSLDEGISLIVVGSQSTTSQKAMQLAENHDGVWAAVGLHPVHLFSYKVNTDRDSFMSRAEEFDYEYYRKLAQDQKVVAIGEMGLDYYRIEGKEGTKGEKGIEGIKEKQKDVFIKGIKLAKELDKPLIIHTRQEARSQGVFADVLKLLKQQDFNKCVLHCFSGNLQQAREFVEFGCMISLTGIVTFKSAREMQQVAREIPLESIMIETDAPYLTPEPHRGQQNEPSYVKHVAEKIAELKQVSFDEVARVTTDNAKKFFRLV